MAEVIIRRNISRQTRKLDSPYRITLDKLEINDTLIVEINDLENNILRKYTFLPGSTKGKKNIHFREFSDKIYWLAGIVPDDYESQYLKK